jgi:hypothetical protein
VRSLPLAFLAVAVVLVASPVIAGAAQSTTTTVSPTNWTSIDHSPTKPGQPISFFANVAPTPDGGTVQFVIDGANFGSPAAVNSTGSANSQNTSFSSPGNHTVQGIYSGTANFGGSTSSSVTFVIVAAASSSPVPVPAAGIGMGWLMVGTLVLLMGSLTVRRSLGA